MEMPHAEPKNPAPQVSNMSISVDGDGNIPNVVVNTSRDELLKPRQFCEEFYFFLDFFLNIEPWLIASVNMGECVQNWTQVYHVFSGTIHPPWTERRKSYWKDLNAVLKLVWNLGLRLSPFSHPFTLLEWPELPLSQIHIDYSGPYKGEMFLLVTDAYTKWLEVQWNTVGFTICINEKLHEIFATDSLAAVLVSDNGCSAEFEEFMKNDIRNIRVAQHHPLSRGLAEWAAQIFKDDFEKMEKESVQTNLMRFLLSYLPPHMTRVPPAGLIKRNLHRHMDQRFLT